jgi:hypothetical protein
MNLAAQIAKQFRDVYFGGNWTGVNMTQTLAHINWQQATTTVENLNTIAALVFHIDYYVCAVLNVLKGEALNASDKFSFDLPPISSEEDWQALLSKTFKGAEALAALIENLDETKLSEVFALPQYGNYYRNIHGVVEHTHYHLGQISLIKKILNKEGPIKDKER